MLVVSDRELDAACGPQIRLENSDGDVRYAMSNSFGFGGSNCTLLFGRERVKVISCSVHQRSRCALMNSLPLSESMPSSANGSRKRA